MEYPKIDTLFERNKDTFVVDPKRLKSPVLGTITLWDVTEKIDGTNVRVMLSETGEVTFNGRTDNAQMPGDLVQLLVRTFTPDAMKAAMWLDGPVSAVLYGEGYGGSIQKGSAYRKDKGFILFDVLVGNKWWLDQAAVNDVAAKLGIEVVPYLGRWTLDQIVAHVQSPFPSKIGTAMAEGIVARPIEPLFDRKGARVIIKLKTRDFLAGKRK
jgi:RNA ligase-like protein